MEEWKWRKGETREKKEDIGQDGKCNLHFVGRKDISVIR